MTEAEFKDCETVAEFKNLVTEAEFRVSETSRIQRLTSGAEFRD